MWVDQELCLFCFICYLINGSPSDFFCFYRFETKGSFFSIPFQFGNGVPSLGDPDG